MIIFFMTSEMGNSNSELELTPELPLFFTGVGVELELNLLIHRWSWSGVKITRSGVGEELDLMHFVNSNSTPFDVVNCPEK